jgi:hypothetical protein
MFSGVLLSLVIIEKDRIRGIMLRVKQIYLIYPVCQEKNIRGLFQLLRFAGIKRLIAAKDSFQSKYFSSHREFFYITGAS